MREDSARWGWHHFLGTGVLTGRWAHASIMDSPPSALDQGWLWLFEVPTLTSLKWWTTAWNSKANRPLFLYPLGCFWSEDFITATGWQIWQPSMRRKDFQSSDQQTSTWKCVHLSTSWLRVIDSLERKIRLWTIQLNKMLRTKSILDFRFFTPRVWRIQIHIRYGRDPSLDMKFMLHT